MPGDAIAFHGVSFSYDGRPLIEGLDLGLRSGCVTGVVGPNGCGKSTLLMLAGGLLPPKAGAVEVAGVRLDALSAKQRAKAVALLPQDTPAVPMTVRDLVSSGRYAHRGLMQSSSKEDGDAVAEAISLVGAEAFAHRPVRSLSGGQRQRAYLAMLLAQHAPVMLLNEPTSALDIRAALDTLALVRFVRETRDASVVVMHDLDLALRYCDRIAVMERGRVVAHGPSDEVAASGILERVFHVGLTAHQSSAGPSYTFFPASAQQGKDKDVTLTSPSSPSDAMAFRSLVSPM